MASYWDDDSFNDFSHANRDAIERLIREALDGDDKYYDDTVEILNELGPDWFKGIEPEDASDKFDPGELAGSTLEDALKLLSTGDDKGYGVAEAYLRSTHPTASPLFGAYRDKLKEALLGSEDSLDDFVMGTLMGPSSGFNKYRRDLHALYDAIKRDTDGKTILDTDNNGTDDVAVVTGSSADELKANAEDAADKLHDDEYDAENAEGDEVASDKDNPFVYSDEDVKKRGGKRECVSDETMKNIIGTLMDYRY